MSKVILNTIPGCDICKKITEFFLQNSISFETIDCTKSIAVCEDLETKVQSFHYPMIQCVDKVYTGGVYVDHVTVFYIATTMEDSKPKKINKKLTAIPCLSISELTSKSVEFITLKK